MIELEGSGGTIFRNIKMPQVDLWICFILDRLNSKVFCHQNWCTIRPLGNVILFLFTAERSLLQCHPFMDLSL
jgi:hypothetical protein